MCRIGHRTPSEQYLHGVAAGLNERGHENFLFYGSSDKRSSAAFARPFEFCTSLSEDGLGPLISKVQPDVIYVHRWTDLREFYGLSDTPPVVRFVHDHDLFCLRTHKFFYWTGRICDRPIGLRCFGCVPFSKKTWRNGMLTWPTAVRRQRESLQAHTRLARIIVATHYMKAQFLLNGFPSEKVDVLPLFTDFPPELNGQPEGNPPMVLFAGRIERGKGLDLLLQALAMVRHPFGAVVAGDGKDLDACRALAQHLRLGTRVAFVGPVSRQQLSALYRQSSIAAIPSRNPESFGLIAIEAMAHGRPVVAFKAGGLQEVVQHGKTGFLVEEHDIDDFARKIERLLTHPDLALEMGWRGVEFVASNYTPDCHIGGLLKIFHEAVERFGTKALRETG